MSEVASPSFIKGLCLALTHHWEPGRLFVILTAYFDESGTHGGDKSGTNPASPVTVMSGILAHARQWERFQQDLDRIKRAYGFKVFHSKDFRAERGEFAGWPDGKHQALIDELGEAGAHLTHVVNCVISNDEFEQYYRGGETPRKLRLDTKYGLCFRCVLSQLELEAIRRFGHHKKWPTTKLTVVVESGNKHAGDVARIFAEMQAEQSAAGLNLLDAIAFKNKHQADPLMIADFCAFGTRGAALAGFQKRVEVDETNIAFRSRSTGWTDLDFPPGALATLKASIVEGMARRRARSVTPAASKGAL